MHLAAESDVDRSISGPAVFVDTNIVGTLHLLEATLCHFETLPAEEHAAFRFLHVSTDEFFGSLGPAGAEIPESHPYRPNSPYAASKAASDHLVRAFGETCGLPVIVTNCGPRQGRMPLLSEKDAAGDGLAATNHAALRD